MTNPHRPRRLPRRIGVIVAAGLLWSSASPLAAERVSADSDVAVTGCGSTISSQRMDATVGGPSRGGWNLWSEGSLSFTGALAAGDTLGIVVRGDFAAGWPNMVVRVDGRVLYDLPVTHDTYRRVDLAVPDGVGTADSDVEIFFTNDHLEAGADRNLHVASATIECDGESGYYVSSQRGDDSYAGTSPERPWRTLAWAIESIDDPTIPLRLERGSIFRETLTVHQSGDDDVPWTIAPYGTGDAPIISGADVVDGWARVGRSTTFAVPFERNPTRVWNGDTELRRSPTPDVSPNQFAHVDGRLYVDVGSNTPPTGIEATRREQAILDTSGHDHLLIRGLVLERTEAIDRPAPDPAKPGNDPDERKYRGVIEATFDSDAWTLEDLVVRHGSGNGVFGQSGEGSGLGDGAVGATGRVLRSLAARWCGIESNLDRPGLRRRPLPPQRPRRTADQFERRHVGPLATRSQRPRARRQAPPRVLHLPRLRRGKSRSRRRTLVDTSQRIERQPGLGRPHRRPRPRLPAQPRIGSDTRWWRRRRLRDLHRGPGRTEFRPPDRRQPHRDVVRMGMGRSRSTAAPTSCCATT